MRSILSACLLLFLAGAAHVADAQTCAHRLLVSGYFSTVHIYDACSGAYIQDLDPQSRLAGPQAIRIGPDGLVYVVAEQGQSVYRYRADTLAFVDKFATLPGTSNPLAIDFGPDGTAYIAGYLSNDVKKYDRNGTLLGAAFAPRAGGILGPEIGSSFGPDGNLYVPGYGSHSMIRHDPRTGTTTQVVAPRQAGINQPRGLVNARDGQTMLMTTEGSGQLLRYNPTTNELTQIRNGLFEPKQIAYGSTGELLVVESTGVTRYDANTFARLGTLVPNGSGGLAFATFVALVPYPKVDAPNTVVEFRNAMLDHYFITADANEIAAIDRGAAGPGWARTGTTFRIGGTTPVCRFYGSQSPGPNSHFYTIDPSECQMLKNLQQTTPASEKRWNYESDAYLSTRPTNNACPAGTVRVWRAYNNGFARGIDSNHRITADQQAILQSIAAGWRDEGVVMCAPE